MKKFSSITRVNSRRTSQIKKLKQVLLITAICVLLLFVVPKVLHIVASVVVVPVQSIHHWFSESGSSFPQYLRSRSELASEIQTLKSEVAIQNSNIYTLKSLTQENATLRKLLGEEQHTRIVAGIIGRPGALPYDSLMLDKGTQSGIQVGAPVYVGTDTVIGVVKSATAGTALVEMITSPGLQTTVYILGPDIYTTAVGIGGGQMKVGVPQGIMLSIGDIVVVPSIVSGVYGEISVVQSEASRPEQYGFVSPETPIASIRLVSVGAQPMQPVSFKDAQRIIDEVKTKLFVVPVPEDILIETDTSTSTGSTSPDTQ